MPIKIDLAARVLHSGGLIAYPTEGVWGLGCDPNRADALARIIELKQRSPNKGLILVAADIGQLEPYLKGLDPSSLKTLANAWPAPVTFLVPDNGAAHPLLKGNFSSVALRVSAHPLITKLCRRFGGPIVSTSANLSGQKALLHGWQVSRVLGDGVDYILHGALQEPGRSSEIRDLQSGQLLRARGS